MGSPTERGASAQTRMGALRDRASALLGSRGATAFAIALVTFLVFVPALWNGFVDWDDKENFLDNPHYRGLGRHQLVWMVTTAPHGHWIPLTWLTLGIDYVLWGMHPAGYHLSNLVLHAAAAAVFFLVSLRLFRFGMPLLPETALRLGAALAALFFSVHPLRAESVAWVTERRDVLSGLLYLLTVLAYLEACRPGARERRWRLASLGAYALALLAKSIVMTLPVVLILLDLYPLRRLPGAPREWLAPRARAVLLEKVPYLALSGVVATVTAIAFGTQSRLSPVDVYPLTARVIVACYSAAFYLWKTLVPANLSPLYEVPGRVDVFTWPYLPGVAAVALLSVVFWIARRRWPAGVIVWLAYLITLAPVSGLVTRFLGGRYVGADRYSYLACMGWAVLVGAAVCAVIQLGPRPARRLAITAATLWIVGLGGLASQQVLVWRNTETLWRYALGVDPSCALCHAQLGAELGNRGEAAAALEHFEHAVALWPGEPGLRSNLGLALLRAGRPAEAVVQLDAAVARRPDDPRARDLLAQALSLEGLALVSAGRPGDAVPFFRRAIVLRSDAPLARFGLARAYRALGDHVAAREQADVLRRLDPALADQLTPRP